MRFFALLVALLCTSLAAKTQQSYLKKLLPVLAPASPEASGFSKYGNYEVNLFTGVPNISIPIYEVKAGEMTVPISINYHASGVKVSDISSNVGLGWSLIAGGSITRKIMDKPDELEGNYLSATSTSANRVRLQSEINTSSESDLIYLNNIHAGYYDIQPDLFSYNLPGHSGKFLFNQKDGFKAFLIPFAPIDVYYNKPSANLLDLNIVDEKGIKYEFNSKESSSVGGGISVNAASAWMLTDMTSSNLAQNIHFTYQQRQSSGITDSYYSDYCIVNDNVNYVNYPYYTNDYGTTSSDAGSISTTWQQLTQIDFPNGKIVFESGNSIREDFGGIYQLQKRLNLIKIYSYSESSNTYKILRTIQFYQTYFFPDVSSSKRLRLDSVKFFSEDNLEIETYKFEYNNNILLPENTSRRKDFWGYFNNQINYIPGTQQETMVPKMYIDYKATQNSLLTQIAIGGTNLAARDPDQIYMQACILKKVIYPTGGFSQFEFETHKYLDEQNVSKFAGGLRVKSIKHFLADGSIALTKNYKYGNGESGFGRNNFYLDQYYFMSLQNFRWMGTDPIGQCNYSTKTTRTYLANPTNDLEGSDGSSVVYSEVSEYTNDGESDNGKIVFSFLDRPDAKTSIIGLGRPIFDSYHFIRGLVTKKAYFKNVGNTYSLVKEERKGYQYFPIQATTGGAGMVSLKRLISQSPGGSDNFCGLSFSYEGCAVWNDINSYQYNNYEIHSGDNKLVSDTLILYDQNNSNLNITTITNYTYDDISHLQNIQITTKNSKEELLTKSFTYPYNYATSPYTSMVNKHIYDKVIKEVSINSVSGQLAEQVNNYGIFISTRNGINYYNYLPINIQSRLRNNPLEKRVDFHNYDIYGKILQMQQASDKVQSYIWDYESTYLLAEAINADQSDIAYTSFESNGTGNFNNYTGVITTVSTPLGDRSNMPPTGNKYYNLTTATGVKLTKTGLTSSKEYIVSYWRNSTTPYTITGGTAVSNGYVAGRTVNGWTYHQHRITGAASITIEGSGGIDEVRIYPGNAQMTTYTYEPLVGMTSQCDVSGKIIYYEYDGFQRLKAIRDQDNNIVKQFDYQYQQQP